MAVMMASRKSALHKERTTVKRVMLLAAFGTLVLHAPAFAQTAAVADPRIAQALQQISRTRIQADIEKLVTFGSRSTLSAQDAASIAAGKGIGAAREWLKSQFERYSQECGGCLEVKTDAFTQEPGG